jgi:hypothetical protein
MQRVSIFLVGFLLLSVAFASPKLLNMWKDPEYKGKMTNVLVVGVTNPGMRQIWENIFVYELGKRGITATASYKLFPDSQGKQAEEILRQKVKEGGYDGVILTTLQNIEKSTKYVPGYTIAAPNLYPSWYGGYGIWYDYWHQPGYEKDITNVRLETTAWDTTGQGKMIWSGLTEAVNVKSAIKVSKDVSSSLIKELSGKKII